MFGYQCYIGEVSGIYEVDIYLLYIDDIDRVYIWFSLLVDINWYHAWWMYGVSISKACFVFRVIMFLSVCLSIYG